MEYVGPPKFSRSSSDETMYNKFIMFRYQETVIFLTYSNIS